MSDYDPSRICFFRFFFGVWWAMANLLFWGTVPIFGDAPVRTSTFLRRAMDEKEREDRLEEAAVEVKLRE